MSRRLLIDDGRIRRDLVLAGSTLVGRDPQCDVSHADPRLSRRHAEFRRAGDGSFTVSISTGMKYWGE